MFLDEDDIAAAAARGAREERVPDRGGGLTGLFGGAGDEPVDAVSPDEEARLDAPPRTSAPTQPSRSPALPSSSPVISPLGAISRIGRYTVIKTLGSGGMGVVLSCYDDELDRRVAIKLLWSEERQGSRERMQREAQALARLSHPNVVQVYEVGEHEGQLFLVMEYIQGTTLRSWLKGQERPWRAVVTMFRQIARGLQAAHEAGLIHRDLKPDNVLVADDGRARILDFGLARADLTGSGTHPVERAGASQTTSPVSAPGPIDDRRPMERPESSDASGSLSRSRASGSVLELELTDADTMLGTPAYMSPEQYTGDPVDARSDLFSLCVMLYEALHRRRPFSGRSLRELRLKITTGQLEAPPSTSRVPAWLHRVALRGLNVEPTARWPSASELERALARDPTRRRRTIASMCLSGAAVGGLGYAVAAFSARANEPIPCEQTTAEFDALWNASTRGELHEALVATGASFAEETWSRIEPTLDAYAKSWRAQRVDACEGHRAGRRGGEAHLLQLACLAQRRASFEGLVKVLDDADETVVQQAAQAAASLPPLARCTDVSALTSGVAPPSDHATATAVQRLRERLAKARAYGDAGRWEQGLALLTSISKEAEALGYEPLVSEVALRRGDILLLSYQGPLAEVALTSAVRVGLACDHDEVVAHALVRRIYVAAELLDDSAKADRDVEFAEVLAGRFPDDDELRWLLANNLGVLYDTRDDRAPALARKSLERALAASYGPAGEKTYRTAFSQSNLASYYLDFGEYDRAVSLFLESRGTMERTLGRGHPYVGLLQVNIATAHRLAREPAMSRAALARARTMLGDSREVLTHAAHLAGLVDDLEQLVEHGDALIERERLAENHGSQAAWMYRTGLAYAKLGDEARARELLRDADALVAGAGALPAEVELDIQLASGEFLSALGEHDAAIGRVEAALATSRRDLGPDNVRTAHAGHTLAVVLRDTQRPASMTRALELFAQTQTQFDALLPEQSPLIATLHQDRARLYELLDQPERALAQHEAALTILSATLAPSNPFRAHAQLLVADALAAAGRPVRWTSRELETALDHLRGEAPAFGPWTRAHEAMLKKRAAP